MQDEQIPDESRRRFLKTVVAAPIALAAPSFIGAACAEATGSGAIDTSQPTLACDDGDDDDATLAQTEARTSPPTRRSAGRCSRRGWTGRRW
jgi:hypothetical protein